MLVCTLLLVRMLPFKERRTYYDHFCNGIPKGQRAQFVHRVSVELNFNLGAYAL